MIEGMEEGQFRLSKNEKSELQRANTVLYQSPSTVEILKGQTEPRLKPSVERHLNEKIIVVNDLSGKMDRFDQGLVFLGFAELLAEEPKVNEAFSVVRGYEGLQQRIRKMDLGSTFKAGGEFPRIQTSNS